MSPLPNEVVLNRELSAQLNQPVIKIEVLDVSPGDELRICFQSHADEWRQGLWLGVDGQLEVAGTRSDQMELWTDTAPKQVDVKVIDTRDGLLRLYNIWDSGRGRRRESQSATSGMLKHEVGDVLEYRCNDIGRNPRFDRLAFEIRRLK
jgi:hypothetical protein